MSYSIVEDLLIETLDTVANLPVLNKENTRYVPKANVPWTRTTFLPAPSTPESLGLAGKKQIQGIFQVDLFYPQDSGTSAANAMADTVVSAFAASVAPTGSGVRVYLQRADRGVGQIFNSFYKLPVVIYWFAFVSK